MTAWTTPRTWTSGSALTAAELNEQVRDNTLHLKESSVGYYATGTWTPALTFSTPGNVVVGYATQTGAYTRVGNLVTVRCQLLTSGFTHTTASGACYVGGLPFAAAGASVGAVALAGPGWGVADYVVATTIAGTTVVQFYVVSSTAPINVLTTTAFVSGSNHQVIFNVTYDI